MISNPFAVTYLASLSLSTIHSLYVIYLVAMLDTTKSGFYLQIFALHPVLSLCGFVLCTTSNMVQTGFNPRSFPNDQPDINKQIALSSIWSCVAWLQIASSSHIKSAALIASGFFALNSCLQMLMFFLSRHRRQQSKLVSPEPLLFSLKDSSRSSSRRYIEKALLLFGCVASGLLLLCMCHYILQTDISLLRTINLLIGCLISSMYLYSYICVRFSQVQLIEISVTFLLQCFQINYTLEIFIGDKSFIFCRSIYGTLSAIFLVLAVLRTFEEKHNDSSSNHIFKITHSRSSRFTIGVEDDEALLEEIPFPPGDA